MSAVIGALRAELSANIAQFESDMGRAAAAVGKFGRSAQRIGQQISAAGRSMTFGITAPVVAFGIAAGKTAGDFEAAMNRVEAATGATGKELKALEAQARAFGRDKTFTATAKDTADAMEILAKNGVSVTDMLGGATKATLTLSAATGANFSDSADVATGVMQQFGMEAGDLAKVVDQVTGVLLVSKFGFDDYKLAMGQAGGVAGGLGITLTDFNTVIAATSTLFASGSDAGTSFKTFLTRLAPQSKQAANVMKQFGLEFFDAQGNMKSMADIAQMLQDKLGGLADEAKNKALTTIFGTDAMRTAIGLMDQGAAGLDRIAAAIDRASAKKQMEARMKGLSGSLQQFRKQFEALMLRIADSGLLEWMTKAVQAFTGFMGALAALPKPLLAVLTAITGLVAVIGPLLVGVGFIAGALANLAPLLPIIGGALAAVAGVLIAPWGLAIAAAVAAVVLFKDQILALVGFLAGEVTRLLGPTFQKIMDDFARIWSAVTSGPIGAAIGFIVKAVGNLAAMLGAVLGEIALRHIAMFLKGFEAVLHLVAAVVEAVSKLLKGDFAGAFDSAAEAVGVSLGAIMDVLNVFLPGVKAVVSAAYKAVKQWIGDGFAAVLAYVEKLLPGLPAAMERAFGAAVGWAKNLYVGIKTWIADNLGPLIKWAIDRINDLKGAFAAIRGEEAKLTKAPAAPAPAAAAPPAAAPGRTRPRGGFNPDVATFEGGGGAGKANAEANAVKAATAKYAEAIRDLNDRIAKGLDEREVPKSVAQAEALRRKIEDISQDAKDAGVNLNTFAGQIGALREQITKLETVGLAKEAERFALEVGKDQRAVNEFAQGGLAPLEAALQEVDDKYRSLRDRITADIEANKVLAEKNEAAAATMKTLEEQLLALDRAHVKAAASARALYQAEQTIANLQAQGELAATRNEIIDLQQASGRNGIMGKQQGELQAIQRDLDQQKLDAAMRLAELDKQLISAREQGDVAAQQRLTMLIDSQTQLYDLVSQTTAIQIQRQTTLQESWDSLADGLSAKLADMLLKWKFDLDGLKQVFHSWANDLMQKTIRQGLDGLKDMAVGAIVGAFKGAPGAAHGGSFKIGGSGVDRHLVALRARADETVHVTRPGEELSGGGMAGGDIIFNVKTPDANSFRASQRQLARQAKVTLARA